MRRGWQFQGGIKVAIVTGANQGLGALISQNLEGVGYRVIRPSRSSSMPLDVGDHPRVVKFVKDILAKNGRIDALVNNAGYSQPTSLLENTPDEDLLNCFQTNIFGPFFMMRAIVPIMTRQKSGTIVNICSKSAVFPVPRLAAYSSSKAALLSLTQAAAKELRNTNILCVAICPAGMNTKMRASVYGSEDATKQQSPQRVADFVSEIITKGTLRGEAIGQGSCVLIRKDEVTVVEMQDG